jgi:hypothetical protein
LAKGDGKFIGIGLLIFFMMNGVTNEIGRLIPQTFTGQTVQVNAINGLLIVDGILLALLGVFVNFDYERLRKAVEHDLKVTDSPRRARNMLRADVINVLVLIGALLVALASLFASDSDTSGLTVAAPFLATTQGMTFLLARIILGSLF